MKLLLIISALLTTTSASLTTAPESVFNLNQLSHRLRPATTESTQQRAALDVIRRLIPASIADNVAIKINFNLPGNYFKVSILHSLSFFPMFSLLYQNEQPRQPPEDEVWWEKRKSFSAFSFFAEFLLRLTFTNEAPLPLVAELFPFLSSPNIAYLTSFFPLLTLGSFTNPITPKCWISKHRTACQLAKHFNSTWKTSAALTYRGTEIKFPSTSTFRPSTSSRAHRATLCIIRMFARTHTPSLGGHGRIGVVTSTGSHFRALR